MNHFLALKVIVFSLSFLFISCQEEGSEPEIIGILNDGNSDNVDETKPIHLLETPISTILQQNLSLTTVPVKQIQDIVEETTTTSTTTSTTTPTTTTSTTIPTTTQETKTTVSSTPLQIIPEYSTEIGNNELRECIKISLNAKMSFKYNSSDGVSKEIQLTGGNINGELIQPNKCDTRQKLVINYEQITKSQLVIWININGTHVYLDEMKFEYPVEKLPNDYKRPENSEELESCSAENKDIMIGLFSPIDKCLIANNKMKNYLMEYKIDGHIRCLDLPIVTLETNNKDESIDILINDFDLVVSNHESDIASKTNDSLCPFVSNNNTIPDSQPSFAGQTKIWLGVTYAIVGGVLIFGVVLLYEKVIRKKLMYTPVKRKEPEV